MARMVEHPGTGEQFELDDSLSDSDAIRTLYEYNPAGFESADKGALNKIFAESIANDSIRATKQEAMSAFENPAINPAAPLTNLLPDSAKSTIVDSLSALTSSLAKVPGALFGGAAAVSNVLDIPAQLAAKTLGWEDPVSAGSVYQKKAEETDAGVSVLNTITSDQQINSASDLLSPSKLIPAAVGTAGTTLGIIGANVLAPGSGLPLALGMGYNEADQRLKQKFPKMSDEERNSWSTVYAVPSAALEYGGAAATAAGAFGGNILEKFGYNISQEALADLTKSKVGKLLMTKALSPMGAIGSEVITENLQDTLLTGLVEGRLPTLNEMIVTSVLTGVSTGGIVGTGRLMSAKTPEERQKVIDEQIPTLDKFRNTELTAQYIAGEIDAADFVEKAKAVGISFRGDRVAFDVEGTTQEERAAALSTVDARLFKALETAKPGELNIYDSFKEGQTSLEDLYGFVKYFAETGNADAFTLDQKYALQDEVFKNNIFAKRNNIGFDPQRTLPLDRSLPIYNSLKAKQGVTDSVAGMAVEKVQDVLSNIAFSTINPQTGIVFESLSDFINSPDGRLQFETISEQTAKATNPDASSLGPDETFAGWFNYTNPETGENKSVFDYKPGDHSNIKLVLGNADTSTVFHELTHFMLTRVDDSSPLSKHILGFVNAEKGLKKRPGLRDEEDTLISAMRTNEPDKLSEIQDLLGAHAAPTVYSKIKKFYPNTTREEVDAVKRMSRVERPRRSDEQYTSMQELDTAAHELVARLSEVYLLGGQDAANLPSNLTPEQKQSARVLGEEMKRLYTLNGVENKGSFDVPEIGTFSKASQVLSRTKSASKTSNFNLKAALDTIFYGGLKDNSFSLEKSQYLSEQINTPTEPEEITDVELEAVSDTEASTETNVTPEPGTEVSTQPEASSVSVRATEKVLPGDKRGTLEELELAKKAKVWFNSEAAKNLYNLETHLQQIIEDSFGDPSQKERRQIDFINALAKELGVEGYRGGGKLSADKRQTLRRAAIDRMVAASREYKKAVAIFGGELFKEFSFGTVHIDAVDPTAFFKGEVKPGVGERFYQTQKVKNALPDTKVVDEKGFPRRVFHGTTAVFQKFSEEFLSTGAGGDLWGKGFYFSEDPKVSSGYATRERGATYQNAKILVSENVIKNRFASIDKYGYLSSFDTFMNALEEEGSLAALKRFGHFLSVRGYKADEIEQELRKYFSFDTVAIPSNVHQVYLDIKNPLDVDAPIGEGMSEEDLIDNLRYTLSQYHGTPLNSGVSYSYLEEQIKIGDKQTLLSLAQTASDSKDVREDVRALLKGPFLKLTEAGQKIHSTLSSKHAGYDRAIARLKPNDTIGDILEDGGKDAIELLKQSGVFDGVTHIGLSGARQWIAWRSDQIHHVISIPLAQKQKKQTLTSIFESVSDEFQRGRGIERPGYLAKVREAAELAYKNPRIVKEVMDALEKGHKFSKDKDENDMRWVVAQMVYFEQIARIDKLLSRGGRYATTELSKFRAGLEDKINNYKGEASDILNLSRAEAAYPAMLALSEAMMKHPKLRSISILPQIMANINVEDFTELKYSAAVANTAEELSTLIKNNPTLSGMQKRILANIDFQQKDEKRVIQELSAALLAMNKDEYIRQLISSYHASNILSNPGGRQRDIASNFLSHMYRLYGIETSEAALELVTSTITGASRTKFIGDVFVNPLKGTGKGLDTFQKIMRNQIKWRDYQRGQHQDIMIMAHAPAIAMEFGNPVSKYLFRALDNVGKFMTATDALQREITKAVAGEVYGNRMKQWEKLGTLEQNLRRLAVEKTKQYKPGKNDPTLEEVILDLMKNPDQLVEGGIDAWVNEVVGQQKPGNLTQGVMKIRDKADSAYGVGASALIGQIPVVKYAASLSPFRIIVPFIPTVANFMKFSIRETAAVGGFIADSGLLSFGGAYGAAGTIASAYWASEKGLKGSELLKNVAASQLRAHMIYYLLAWLFDNDWLVAGPESPAQADAWKRNVDASGQPNPIKPYSFKVNFDGNERYVPFPDPFAFGLIPVLESIASSRRIGEVKDEADAMKMHNKAMLKIQSYLTNSSFLGEAFRMSSSTSGVDISKLASGFLPFSGFMRSVVNSYNTVKEGGAVMYDTDKMQKALMEQQTIQAAGNLAQGIVAPVYGEHFAKFFGQVIPGLEENIPRKITYFGKDITQQQIMGLNLPWQWMPKTPDLTNNKMEAGFSAAQWYPGLPAREREVYKKKVKLNDEQYRSYCLSYGQALNETLSPILDNLWYQQLPVDKKQDYLNKKASEVREREFKKVVREYGL